jgi:preprotein translocase subunit SecA
MGLIKRLFDSEYKELSKFKKIADKIEALDEEYQKKSDKDLAAMTDILREELANGKTINDEDIIVRAFATIREVAYKSGLPLPAPIRVDILAIVVNTFFTAEWFGLSSSGFASL